MARSRAGETSFPSWSPRLSSNRLGERESHLGDSSKCVCVARANKQQQVLVWGAQKERFGHTKCDVVATSRGVKAGRGAEAWMAHRGWASVRARGLGWEGGGGGVLTVPRMVVLHPHCHRG